MKHIKLFLITGLTLSIVGVLYGVVNVSHGESADSTYFFNPSNQTVNPSNNFSVQLRAKTGRSFFSSYVYISIKYPPNLLNLTSISSNGTAYPIQQEQSYNNQSGEATIYRYTSSTPTGTDNLVATLNFRATAAGTAAVTLQDVLTNTYTTTGTYTIVTPPSPVTPVTPSPPIPSPQPTAPTQITTKTPTTAPASPTAPSTTNSTAPINPIAETTPPSSVKAEEGIPTLKTVTSTILYDSAEISWKAEPNATYTIVYGQNSDKLDNKTADISVDSSGVARVKLTKLIPGKTYSYTITLKTKDKKTSTYKASFTTKGYPVVVKIIGNNKQGLANLRVKIAKKDLQTDKHGEVHLALPNGKITVTIANKDYPLRVEAKNIPKKGTSPETQRFQIDLSTAPPPYVLIVSSIGFIIFLAGILLLILKKNRDQKFEADSKLYYGVSSVDDLDNALWSTPQETEPATPPATKAIAEPALSLDQIPSATIQEPEPLFPDLTPTVSAPETPSPELIQQAMLLAHQQELESQIHADSSTPGANPSSQEVVSPRLHHNSVYLDEEEPKDMYEIAEEKEKERNG